MALVPPLPGSLLSTVPLLLGGFLPLDSWPPTTLPVCGRWVYPVGDTLDYRVAGPDGTRPYAVTRGVTVRRPRHSGVDLSNREGGGLVRAAADGRVIAAHDAGNGYGLHVVVAHRLPDDRVLYSVYAHLARGSVLARPGDDVTRGERIGIVGSTGTATSPHLHFELRRPRSPTERWERATPVDPIDFVADRLPTGREPSWADPYLAWAEHNGWIAPHDAPDSALARAVWRRALASLHCDSDPSHAEAVPPSEQPGGDDRAPDPVSWKEVALDLAWARAAGLCLPSDPPAEPGLRTDCRKRLHLAQPARHLDVLARRKGAPTLAEITLLLSDLASD